LVQEVFEKKKRKKMVILLVAACVFLLSGIGIFMAQSFVIQFDSRGGEDLVTMKTTRLGSTTLPTPSRPGQTFLGWTRSSSPGSVENRRNIITSTGQINRGTVLYAHWEETNFVLNFYNEGEQVNQLGFDKDTKFIDAMLAVAPFRDFFRPVPSTEPRWSSASFREDPESGQLRFVGWRFRDIAGDPAYLWYRVGGAITKELGAGTDISHNVDPNIWTLEYFDSSAAGYDENLGKAGAYQHMELNANQPFLPQLYDGTMHAVWEYRKLDIEGMVNESTFPVGGASTGGTDARYGETLPVGTTGSLSRTWYQQEKALIGWKIGFRSGGFSPLKVDTVGEGHGMSENIMLVNIMTAQGVQCRLSPAQLQRINDLFDKTHPISEPFYVDPLLAYLAYQITQSGTSVRTHTLFIYPVLVNIAEDGTSETRFYDTHFSPITESSSNIRRVLVSQSFSHDGVGISLGLPRPRSMQTFEYYFYEVFKTDANGNVEYETVTNPNTGVSVKVPIREKDEDDKDIIYNTVTAAEIQRQNQVFLRHGVTVSTNNMHSEHATIFYEKWSSHKTRVIFDYGPEAEKNRKTNVYSNGRRLIHSLTYGGWGSDNDRDIKERFVDSTPVTQLQAEPGQKIILPSASMYTRQNRNFIGWQEATQSDGKPGRIYPAGFEYTVLADYGFEYTLTAVWSDSTINFAFTLAGGRGFNPADLGNWMRGRKPAIDATGNTYVRIPLEEPTRFGYDFVRWESDRIDPENNNKREYAPGDNIRIMREKQILTAVWRARDVSMTLHYSFEDVNFNTLAGTISLSGKFDQTIRLQTITPQSTSAAHARSFDELYRLAGWTFRDPANVNDSRGVTLAPTQTVNLNDRIVREVPGGLMRSDGFMLDEKNAVSLIVYEAYGRDMIGAPMSPSVNSEPRLTRSAYQSHIISKGLDITHDFVGFFALPQEVVDHPSFDIEHYWNRETGTYKTNAIENIPGQQFLRFYEMIDESGERIEAVGRDGSGVAQNYRITTDMYFFMWLQPKRVFIDFFGINEKGDGTWEHTAEPVISNIESYFGDNRAEVMNLGHVDNVNKRPITNNFFFLDWLVEYYTFGAYEPFQTQTMDLMIIAGTTNVMFPGVRLDLDTSLIMYNPTTEVRLPVHRIRIKPNMQSVDEFIVRIIDDGTITGTRGTAFNVTFTKQDQEPIVDGNTTYVGGAVVLDSKAILASEIRFNNPQWGAERWPYEIYGGQENYETYGEKYWWGEVYVGPGSPIGAGGVQQNPRVSMEDLLDHHSRTITEFRGGVTNLDGTGPWAHVAGPTYKYNDRVQLRAGPNGTGFFDVRSGTVSLYPVYGEISYAIEIVNGLDTTAMTTLIHAVGGMAPSSAIWANDGLVQLGHTGGISNIMARQPGYYFDEERENLNTVNYMLPEFSHIPGNQRAGMFKVGESYRVGHLVNQIPPRTVDADGRPLVDSAGRKIIRLYIVWLPSAVAISYENTDNAETQSGASNIHVDSGFEVGDSINLRGRVNTWFRPGYRMAGWSLNQNGSEPRFSFDQNGHGMQQVLLAAAGATNPGEKRLNVTRDSPTITTRPYLHTLTVKLYPWWEATEALSVTFDISPLPGDTNVRVSLEAGNRFLRPHVEGAVNWSPVPGQNWYRSVNRFAFDGNLGNVEADWRMFNYHSVNSQGQPIEGGNDFRLFGGWTYLDQRGITHDLEVVNGQIKLDEIFLAHNDNPNSIVSHIMIRAKWISDTQPLIQYNIANEAIQVNYEIERISRSKNCEINSQENCTLVCEDPEFCNIVKVSVRNGVSGDVEFTSHAETDADGIPYKLLHNAYIGPRLSNNNPRYPNINTHPQFYRTEVAVKTIGDDGKAQIIVKALNPMYEKLAGTASWDVTAVGRPDNRVSVSKANPLVRYETRRIPSTSASQIANNHPIGARLAERTKQYTTQYFPNYAMFDGRGGHELTGTGVTLETIYETFVMGAQNNRYQGDQFAFPYDTLDDIQSGRFTNFVRMGYELIGFAISDQYNQGVAFGTPGAPNEYVNRYLFWPRPERIIMVPIYKPIQTTLTLNPNFQSNAELKAYTDVIYAPRCSSISIPENTLHSCLSTCNTPCEIKFPQHVCTSLCAGGTIVPSGNDNIVISIPFDSRLDLPFLETRGKNKNPLLDTPEWMSSWVYGDANNLNEVYTIYGDRPSSVPGSRNVDNALGFHVKHNPHEPQFPHVTANADLTFRASWTMATKMDISYHVLVPQAGVPMNQWVAQPLKFDPAAINRIANPGKNPGDLGYVDAHAAYRTALGLQAGDNGSIAQHYRKPVLENGVYNYSRAPYTIPIDSSGAIDSAFGYTPNIDGVRPIGWFMEHMNTNKPLIIQDEDGSWGLPRQENSSGKMEYTHRYHDGIVDRYWQQEASTQWTLRDLTPENSVNGIDGTINVYLVYDWPQGTITYHSGDANYDFPNRINVRAGQTVTLPNAMQITHRQGKIFGGWSKIDLQRMRSSVQWESDIPVNREGWQHNDFVRVAQPEFGSGPAYFRKVGLHGQQGTLERIDVYKGDYIYSEGFVDFFAIWEELMIEHTFMDGSVIMWGRNALGNIESSTLYGLESGSVPLENGELYGTQYFRNNEYGNGTSSVLPKPTKEGSKFLRWEDSHKTVYETGTNLIVANGVTRITLFAVWAEYFYHVEFRENNGEGPKWNNVHNDILSAQTSPIVAGGKVVTEYGASLRIPIYSSQHFTWSLANPELGMLGWTLRPTDSSLVVDTRTSVQFLSFGNNNSSSGSVHTVKVGRLDLPNSSSLEYIGQPELVGNRWVRTIRLYALWNVGSIEVNYFDGATEIHAQDAYMLSSDRKEITSEGFLPVPFKYESGVRVIGDADFMQYGIMVADESVIPTAPPAGKSFGGWRVRRAVGLDNPVGRIYYPGDYLDGAIRANVELEAIWLDGHNNWDTIARDNGTTFQNTVLVIPDNLGINYFNTGLNELRVINPHIKTIILPRMTNGTIGENRIVAHGVTRIVLPSVGELTVAPQAIKAKLLEQLYIGENLNISGNPVGGEARINQSTGSSGGAIEIESAMRSFRVKQGAFNLEFPEGGVAVVVPAVVGGTYNDVPEDPNYLRGGHVNRRTAKYTYFMNQTYWGSLYCADRFTLFAYPSTASTISLHTSVYMFAPYAFAYMPNLTSSGTSDLTVIAPSNSAAQVAARAVFNTTAFTIRLPQTTRGTGVDVNAISGYQPNLASVRFGTTGNTTSAAGIGFFDGSLYRSNTRTHLMYVANVVGNDVTIPSSVSIMNNYALSSFYRSGNISRITIDANVSLTVGHFQNPEHANERAQHTFRLTEFTLGGSVTGIDHRVFSRMGSQFTRLNIKKNGIILDRNTMEPDDKTFPIFVDTASMLLNYMSPGMDWENSWGLLTVNNVASVPTGAPSANFRMQTVTKGFEFDAGSIDLPGEGIKFGTGPQPSVVNSVFNGANLVIPNNTYTAPDGTAFAGWRVASTNSAIDGMIYQPGWEFKISMQNSPQALDQQTPVSGIVYDIYIQSLIKLTAIWEVRNIQFIDKDGNTMNQAVLVHEGGGFRTEAATNIELAGKTVNIQGETVVAVNPATGQGTLNFALVGANHTFVHNGDTYGFVGWIKRANRWPHSDWYWGNTNNIGGRLIPDGASAGTVNLRIDLPCAGNLCNSCIVAPSFENCLQGSAIVYYHALYDIISTNIGTVRYNAIAQSTHLSAEINSASITGSGNIGIPAAVIDTDPFVQGVPNPLRGFMRQVTMIPQGAFANMTGIRNKVYIGGNVTDIFGNAFMNSQSIGEINFGHNFVAGMPDLHIGSYAFGNLRNLGSNGQPLKLPLATATIGANAFVDNLALTSVQFETQRGGAIQDARLRSIGAYAFR